MNTIAYLAYICLTHAVPGAAEIGVYRELGMRARAAVRQTRESLTRARTSKREKLLFTEYRSRWCPG